MAAVAESAIGSGDHLGGPPPLPSPDEQREEAEYGRDVRELVELLSNLNPSAKEFVPATYSPDGSSGGRPSGGRLSADAPEFFLSSDARSELVPINGDFRNAVAAAGDGSSNGNQQFPRMTNYNQARRRLNDRIKGDHKEDCVRRTVYVSDVDQHVTEEQLAAVFISCGKVLDCRICGDPRSILRFAFIEFANESGARAALSLAGTVLGFFPIKVLPSKTAILPVNPTFLPRSEDEREKCSRTVYCTNIDKKVAQSELKEFFESSCGEVSRLRLLWDYSHTTHIAFVEFVQAKSALIALNCSGLALGDFPIRVSPSKTPVRPRNPRTTTMESI